jgi:chromosome segregation ATPase
MRIDEHKGNIKEINQDLKNDHLTNESEQEEVSNIVEVYKEQKKSLEVLSSKLLSKFQEVVDNAEKSFVKLQESIEKYEEKLSSKKKELAENSSVYYNLKNISDSSISDDIQKRIEEHLNFLEATGNTIINNNNRKYEKGKGRE